jgi:tetratricopeptide (TPR) repeat protein
MSLRGLTSPLTWRDELERSEQLRRRVLAFGGLWLLLAGFLAALGISIFFFASVVLLLVGGLAAATIALFQRDGTRERIAGIAHSMENATHSFDERLGRIDLRERAQASAAVASRSARNLAQSRRRKPVASDPGRRARRLNTLGVQLRRDGEYDAACDQHRAALTMVRELGDERAEALTLNNLALALVHTDGGVPAAIEGLEHARDLLQRLGDEELEGQVIANLASIRRRQGRDEDAQTLLSAALDKLPPESPAYRQVEEQLRRAS